MAQALRIAADVGGTFTDIACVDAQGELWTCKLPSTPQDFAAAILDGIGRLTRDAAAASRAAAEVLHASTIATNAILEGKGARTALVTTQGFRDVLELRRIRVPRLYEPLYEKPPPLVPRRLRLELRERMDARGAVLVPIDEAQLQELAATLAASGVEAVAIALLHSYANPAHERRVAEVLRAALPGCFICTSSEVLPEIREYERTSTTVVNAYIGPVVTRYLEALRTQLAAAGFGGRLLMMQSSGGTIDVQRVIARPATVVESGPAAGVIGALRLGVHAGYENLITFDMGGTTAKASLIEQGAAVTTDEYEIGGGISLSSQLAKGGGYALKLPVIDVSEVGAGGGSLVRVDAGGALRVGPESAGAVPGPACYGRGGAAPTVTDANVLLGYLNPTSLAGGSVPIDLERSRAAFEPVAGALGVSLLEAAHGVHRLANATMMRAVKAVSTYRGRDPRDYTLFAFGGNGGVCAAALAADLRMRRVVVPPGAGVFSAIGLLAADLEAVRSAAFLHPLDSDAVALMPAQFARLEQQAVEELGARAGVVLRWQVELRYEGQGFALAVDIVRAGNGAADSSDVRTAFEREYQRTFGHVLPGSAIQIVALRVIATLPPAGGARAVPRLRRPAQLAAPTSRAAYFSGESGTLATPVLQRWHLDATARPGPLIIEEYEGTTVVPPGARAARDEFDNIVITLG
jgi:N-methylhydantoinase A